MRANGGLQLPGRGKAGVRGIAAERSGADAAGEERGQGVVVLSYPFEGYFDGAGYVDPGALGGRGCPPIT